MDGEVLGTIGGTTVREKAYICYKVRLKQEWTCYDLMAALGLCMNTDEWEASILRQMIDKRKSCTPSLDLDSQLYVFNHIMKSERT